MSFDIPVSFIDAVTDISATAKYPVGTRRFENGKEYVYQQADDAVTAGQAVMLDAAASASGQKITPTSGSGASCLGICETAITDEYYGWVTVGPKGAVVSAIVKTGVAVDDPLAPSATAGALVDAVEAGSGDYEFVCFAAMEANSSGSDASAKVMFL